MSTKIGSDFPRGTRVSIIGVDDVLDAYGFYEGILDATGVEVRPGDTGVVDGVWVCGAHFRRPDGSVWHEHLEELRYVVLDRDGSRMSFDINSMRQVWIPGVSVRENVKRLTGFSDAELDELGGV